MTLVQRTAQLGAIRSRIWFPRISTQNRLGSIWPDTIRWGADGCFSGRQRAGTPTERRDPRRRRDARPVCRGSVPHGWRSRRDRARGPKITAQQGYARTLANPLQLTEVRGLHGVTLRLEPQLDTARGDHFRKGVESGIPPAGECAGERHSVQFRSPGEF